MTPTQALRAIYEQAAIDARQMRAAANDAQNPSDRDFGNAMADRQAQVAEQAKRDWQASQA